MAISTPTKRSLGKTRDRSKRGLRSHIDVSLIVRSPTIDPGEITRELGLAPTKTWRPGDLVHPPATHRFKDNGWELKGKRARGSELTKYVEALIQQVDRSAGRLAILSQDVSIYVQCDVCDREFRRTNLSLSRDAIDGLARLGAEIDIDYYDLSHADDEE